MKILILGVNGFIGNALVRRILANRDWEVFGMDLHSNKIAEVLDNPRFHYLEGDIAINKEWIEYHIKKCDVALPLVARDPKPNAVYCADEYEAAKGTEALIIATEWNQFRGLNFDRLKESMTEPVILDLRNIYEPEAMRRRGFAYTCVGR